LQCKEFKEAVYEYLEASTGEFPQDDDDAIEMLRQELGV